jgi:gluconate/galactonate dehydratase
MGIDFTSRREREPGLLIDYSTLTGDLDEERAPGPRDLEITDVQTTMVDGNFDWTLVRIYTDAGVVGTGEAYWGSGVPGIIESTKPLLVGENPLDIDRLYTHLIQRLSGEGSLAGAVVTAVSGIEIALHDLAGKVFDVPAYQLLGGKYRDNVRVYCDTHAGAHGAESDAAEHREEHSPEAYARAAQDVVADGFDALKFDLDVPSGLDKDRMNRHLRESELQHKVDIVEAATEAVDDDVDVAFDCHWSWSGDSATRLANAVEEYDVFWLEDPVPPENHDVQKTVTRSTETTIATGENAYRKHGFRTLIEDEAVDVIQPDLPKMGGMREVMKVASAADTYYIPFALHNVSSPIGTMAGAQTACACPNFLALEYHARAIDWWDDLVEEPVIEEGYITIPERPGLGLTLDLDVVEEHMVEGETLFDPA